MTRRYVIPTEIFAPWSIVRPPRNAAVRLTREFALPQPGSQLSGWTVIASVVTDDEFTPVQCMCLVLTDLPGSYYGLVNAQQGRNDDWELTSQIGLYPNIVPAAEAYEQNGGDY